MNTLINIDRIKLEITLKEEFKPEVLDVPMFTLSQLNDEYEAIPTAYNHKGILHFGSYKIANVFWSTNESKKKNLILDFNKDIFCTQFSIINFMDALRVYLNPVKESVTYLEIYKVSMDDHIWKSLFEISTNLATAYHKYTSKYRFNSKSTKRFHTMNDFKGYYIVNVDSSNDSVIKNKQKAVIYKKTNITPTQKAFYITNNIMMSSDDHVYKHEIRLYSRSLRYLEKKGYDLSIEGILNPEFQEEILDFYMNECLTFQDLTNHYYDHNRNKKYNLFKLWKEETKILTKRVLKDSKPNNIQLKKRNNKPFITALKYYYENPKPEYFRIMTDEIINNGIRWNDQISKLTNDFNMDYDVYRMNEIKQEIQVFIDKELFDNIDYLEEIPF